MTEICKAHNIEIAASEKSRGSLTVEQYKEYAQIKELTDEKKKEAAALENKIANTEYVLGQRQELLTGIGEVIDRLDAEYQEKNIKVEQLDSAISKKQNTLAKTDTALAEKQAILNESAHKVFKISYIDNIETGKTMFGGKVTVAPDDYNRLTDLAKKQIAAESKEGELTAEVTKLKKENEELTAEKEQLTEQNAALRNENGMLQSVYGRMAIAKLRSELDNLQRKFDKVMKFIESLNLTKKLNEFLNPIKRGLRR